MKIRCKDVKGNKMINKSLSIQFYVGFAENEPISSLLLNTGDFTEAELYFFYLTLSNLE